MSSVGAFVGPASTSQAVFINELFSTAASTRFITDPCVDLSQWTVSGNNGNQFTISNDIFYFHRDPVDTRYNDLMSNINIPSDAIVEFDLRLKAPAGDGGVGGGNVMWFRGGAYALEFTFGWDTNNNINFAEISLWKDPNSSQVETVRLAAMFPDLSLFSSLTLNTEAVLPNLVVILLGGNIKVFAGSTLLIDVTDSTPITNAGYVQFYPARNIDTIGLGNLFIGSHTPDPSTWSAFGAGDVVNGQYLMPAGESGGLTTVQTLPAGTTFTLDVIIPNCPEGNQYFGICGLQYDFVTNANAVGVNMFLQCSNGVITGCQLQNNDGLFYIPVPLNLLQITGNTVVVPQMSVKVLPGAFTLSIAGTQVINWSNPIYQPSAGQFFVYNDYYSGVSLAFDNIHIAGPSPDLWKGLIGLPGIQVIRGLVLQAPLDTRGHGHASDILPAGTNFAILVLTKGRTERHHEIDGYETLEKLEGPHHTGQDWDQIDDSLGGLVFFGSLTSAAKKQFQAMMKNYTQQYK